MIPDVIRVIGSVLRYLGISSSRRDEGMMLENGWKLKDHIPSSECDSREYNTFLHSNGARLLSVHGNCNDIVISVVIERGLSGWMKRAEQMIVTLMTKNENAEQDMIRFFEVFAPVHVSGQQSTSLSKVVEKMMDGTELTSSYLGLYWNHMIETIRVFSCSGDV